MEWFKKLPLEEQYYNLYIVNLFGTLICISLALSYQAWSWYLCAAWTLSSVFYYMKKEKELYDEDVQT